MTVLLAPVCYEGGSKGDLLWSLMQTSWRA